MRLINQNDEFKIYKDEHITTKYKIELNEPSIPLINSIKNCRIIPGLTIEDDYKTIHFKATSVKVLSMMNNLKNFGINEMLTLCYYMSLQLKYIITEENMCFINYDIEKIIIVDQNKYFFFSNNNLFPLDSESENNIYIYRPFKKTIFSSPELKNIYNIPTSINYRSIYYSLGLVILYCLRQNMNISEDEWSNENILNMIEGTKLYHFLKCALDEDVEKRRLIYL
jgi:hypothetical protein